MRRENDKSAPTEALFNWYPGHMAKALREIKQKLTLVDIILEVRDARAPLATGNFELNNQLGQKKKIIILNKANLADPGLNQRWSEWFDKHEQPHFFVNALDRGAMKQVVPMARKIVLANRRVSNPDYVETKSRLKLMIVGLPNTGKSTIINQLTARNIAKVADKPGQTKIQQWIEMPDGVDLMDTPGVMPPKIGIAEHALWLSALHAIPDDVANEDDTAVFVVKHMLAKRVPEFLERYKFENADLSLDDALLKIATLRGCIRQKGLPDLDRVYKLLLAEFREGTLGRTTFEVPPAR
jgi:ribosome biogenesis GTPase A